MEPGLFLLSVLNRTVFSCKLATGCLDIGSQAFTDRHGNLFPLDPFLKIHCPFAFSRLKRGMSVEVERNQIYLDPVQSLQIPGKFHGILRGIILVFQKDILKVSGRLLDPN